ncbi:MAG: zf-HC2 domain-containing protein [Candidatus Krumholzibacteriales bacterium]
MKHKSIRKLLLRYLDDDLSEREKTKVWRHLESCRECRDALKAIEWMWVKERPVERKKAPPFLWTRIAARLQPEAKQVFPKKIEKIARPALRLVVTVAALFFIIFSGIKLGGLMTGNSGESAELSTERITDDYGMSYFEILPPGSINVQVLALNESERQE